MMMVMNGYSVFIRASATKTCTAGMVTNRLELGFKTHPRLRNQPGLSGRQRVRCGDAALHRLLSEMSHPQRLLVRYAASVPSTARDRGR